MTARLEPRRFSDMDDMEQLLQTLAMRFEKNMHRHEGIRWSDVEARLADNAVALRSLSAMEATGGEPDVIARDETSGGFVFVDCSKETPKGRRSLCYDRAALESRKEHKPRSSATDLAAEMGIDLLTEDEYLELQRLGPFDTKTSSWLHTPKELRDLGGALFGDHRFGRTFIYHNGAESYYGVRGFRGKLRV